MEPHSVERKLTAILSADVKGYSRLMDEDEEATLHTLTAYRAVMDPLIHQHRGRIVGTAGDSVLAEFASVVDAVRCAAEIQQQLKAQNADLPTHRQMEFRIGINLGDVMVEGEQIYGDGVNVAARLQSSADAGGIFISGTVYDQVENKLALTYEYLGEQAVKNIAKPVRMYRVREADTIAAAQVKSKETALWLPLPDKPSLIVLPFVNLSSDPEQEYFSDGITEDITTDLSKISSLFVISRHSASTYKGNAAKAQDISREMGVRYVLEGSVRKAGERLRITAQLIDATTDHHLWSERYDRSLTDIFALQDEIVQKIVTTLKLQLTLWEQGLPVRKRTTDNLEAYDYLLRGRNSYWRLTKEANAQARQMYEKAIELDPQCGEAYVHLGWTYLQAWTWRWSQDPQTLERAFELGQKAIALDDSLPLAHGLLSFVYLQKQQPDQAIAESERAIALDPNNDQSYTMQAAVLNSVGRWEEALRSVEQAMRLNPRYPAWYSFELGNAYLMTGRYAEAIAALKQVVLRSPNFLYAYTRLAKSYMLQWDFQLSHDPQALAQALAAAQRAVALNDSAPWAHTALSYVYLWQKQYEQALAEMERTIALDLNVDLQGAALYAALAEVLSWVGRPEEAMRMVEQALRLKPSAPDLHLGSIGAAYYLAGRPEEAIAPLKQYLSRYPNFLGAHLTLAAAYSELGRETEARTEAAEVLRINPYFSLEIHRQRVPIKDPAVLERHLAALRKAGLK